MAAQIGRGKLCPAGPPHPLCATPSPGPTHSCRAVAEDGRTHLSAELQTAGVLSFSPILLISSRYTTPGPEKDLLGLTQRWRE